MIGPYADNKGISGAWSIYNEKNENTITIKHAISEYLNDTEILYARGCQILEENEINNILSMEGKSLITHEDKNISDYINEAIEIANKADVIILAIGEHYKQSGEGSSRSNIEIPKIQENLLNVLSTLNKPIVAIVFSR